MFGQLDPKAMLAKAIGSSPEDLEKLGGHLVQMVQEWRYLNDDWLPRFAERAQDLHDRVARIERQVAGLEALTSPQVQEAMGTIMEALAAEIGVDLEAIMAESLDASEAATELDLGDLEPPEDPDGDTLAPEQ